MVKSNLPSFEEPTGYLNEDAKEAYWAYDEYNKIITEDFTIDTKTTVDRMRCFALGYIAAKKKYNEK